MSGIFNCCFRSIPFFTPTVKNEGLENDCGSRCNRIMAVSMTALAVFVASLYASVAISSTFLLLAALTPIACAGILIADCILSGRVLAEKCAEMDKICADNYMKADTPDDRSVKWLRQSYAAVQLIIDQNKDNEKELARQFNKVDAQGNRCLLHHDSRDDVLALILKTVKDKADFIGKDKRDLSFFEEVVKYGNEDCVKTIIKHEWVTRDYARKMNVEISDKVKWALAAYVGTGGFRTGQDLRDKFDSVSKVMGGGKFDEKENY